MIVGRRNIKFCEGFVVVMIFGGYIFICRRVMYVLSVLWSFISFGDLYVNGIYIIIVLDDDEEML